MHVADELKMLMVMMGEELDEEELKVMQRSYYIITTCDDNNQWNMAICVVHHMLPCALFCDVCMHTHTIYHDVMIGNPG